MIFIQPQPDAGEENERFNWDSPVLISPHDPARLYFASQRVWRSDDRGDSWTPISGDLSHGIKQAMMGRTWSINAAWDLWAMSKFGTITSLSESPLLEGLLYAGTDDGRIHVSEDSGQNWFSIERLPDVPDAFFVNDIKADLHDADTVYVVVDDHKSGDFSPYVLKSTDRGRSWKSISENLPERHVVWRIVQDHVNPKLFFLGTEFGVFFSIDGGNKWAKLSGGAPTIPFRDLAIQKRENDLVGATFGRGFWILDDYTPLRTVTGEQLQREATLFPVRDALWYIPSLPLGDFKENGKASQGDGFFIAPNPPFGAVFTYYLKDGLKSRQEQRRENEKKLAAEGSDTPYPGWDAIRAEETEEAPAIVMTVTDVGGDIVRRIEGPVEAGFHRVAWDLRYPLSSPWTAEASGESYIHIPGPLAAPGTYQVSLARRVNGQLTELGTQSFDVVQMREPGLKGASPEQVVAFTRQVDDLNRQVQGAASAIKNFLTETGAIKQTLLRSGAALSLRDAVRALELELMGMQDRINDNVARDLYGDPGPVSISQRLNVVMMGTFRSSYGPTPTHVRSLEIAASEFSEVKTRLQEIHDTGLPALRRQLDEAGVPWTPHFGFSLYLIHALCQRIHGCRRGVSCRGSTSTRNCAGDSNA